MDLLQVLGIGLSLAAYYALVSVGFALIFATLRIFHIAHGTVFISAGYLFFLLHRIEGIGLFLSGVIAVAGAALLGLAIDKLIYLPVIRRGGRSFSTFIASLGIALVFEAAYLVTTKGVVSVARTDSLDVLGAGNVVVRWLDLVALGIVAVVYGLLYLWFHRTKVGLEVRGLTDNGPLAAIVGVDVDRTRNYVFLVASALAGVAGILTAYDTGINPDTGMRTLFIAVVAVILGGVRNLLVGTIIGSLALGLLTAYAGFLFPEWVTFSVFMVVGLLILGRPEGLFGGSWISFCTGAL